MNVLFDPQGCQTLLLKESDPFLFSLGSWTKYKLYHAKRIFNKCASLQSDKNMCEPDTSNIDKKI